MMVVKESFSSKITDPSLYLQHSYFSIVKKKLVFFFAFRVFKTYLYQKIRFDWLNFSYSPPTFVQIVRFRANADEGGPSPSPPSPGVDKNPYATYVQTETIGKMSFDKARKSDFRL